MKKDQRGASHSGVGVSTLLSLYMHNVAWLLWMKGWILLVSICSLTCINRRQYRLFVVSNLS